MMKEQSPGWAVLRTGAKQYRVSVGEVLMVERSDFFRAAAPPAELNPQFVFDDVLAIGIEGRVVVGTPLVRGARVTAELLPERRLKKVLVFKKRRRKNSRRKGGHRQCVQPIRVLAIEPGVAADVREGSDIPAQPFKDRVDLGSVVSEARRGSSEAVISLAERAAATDWSPFSTSDKNMVSASLRAHETDGRPSVARSVATALEMLERPTYPKAKLSHSQNTPASNYQLSLDVRRQAAVRQGQLGLQVHGSILSDLRAPRADSGSTPRLRPDFTVSGPGSIPGSLRLAYRKEMRPGVAAEFVLEFQCRDTDDPVVLTVEAGKRTMRRFIIPSTLQVSRTPPLSLLQQRE
jgi:large subunit ribosomal protein L21